ncbi:alginate lyase-domain-containing protein [Mycena galopus ATCC 62051]|nr:alginate lyase-domain-containing protein [Mycena galopus ATCC 62051]
MHYSHLAPVLALLFALADAQKPGIPGELLIQPVLNNGTFARQVRITPTLQFRPLGKCLTAQSNADSGAVTIQACTSAAAQKWTFNDGSVKIFGSKCLDVTDGKTNNGNKLQIWTCSTNNPNQQFWWTDDQHFAWTNHGKCIDLTDGNQADGNNPQIWDCASGDPNQIWNSFPATSEPGTNACGTSSITAALNVTAILNVAPNTVVLDGSNLLDARNSLMTNSADAGLKAAVARLKAQADALLSQGPWSVTDKKVIGPGAGIHDYTSQAPYFWPSNTSDGCPYFNRDGVRNPETLQYTDHDERAQMFNASYILSLAWYYTGEEKYACKAGDVLRTWFITPTTKMNPDLNHAQFIPCENTGRSIGIIDFSQGYTSVVDAAAILASTNAPGWTSSDISAFFQWNSDFLNWLETSDFGKAETAATNNHGVFALQQSAGIALFLCNSGRATSKAQELKQRIDAYINPDGSQPQELSRTRSFHYSTFALVAYTRLAAIGQKVGVDLWGYTGSRGQSIQKAVEFIIPAATGKQSWNYPELNFTPYSASDIIHASADQANNAAAKQAVGLVQTPPQGDLWPARPAVEQLDPLYLFNGVNDSLVEGQDNRHKIRILSFISAFEPDTFGDMESDAIYDINLLVQQPHRGLWPLKMAIFDTVITYYLLK